MSTILLATDGSPSAEQATAIAIELASVAGRPLRVVSVWRTPVTAAIGYGTVGLPTEIIEAERQYANDVAERAAELARRGGAQGTFQIREGDPADEICAAAEECAAGMIVIGAHGWGPLHRVLFGSVSTRVLHEAPCGVLVVRGERSREHAATAA